MDPHVTALPPPLSPYLFRTLKTKLVNNDLRAVFLEQSLWLCVHYLTLNYCAIDETVRRVFCTYYIVLPIVHHCNCMVEIYILDSNVFHALHAASAIFCLPAIIDTFDFDALISK